MQPLWPMWSLVSTVFQFIGNNLTLMDLILSFPRWYSKLVRLTFSFWQHLACFSEFNGVPTKTCTWQVFCSESVCVCVLGTREELTDKILLTQRESVFAESFTEKLELRYWDFTLEVRAVRSHLTSFLFYFFFIFCQVRHSLSGCHPPRLKRPHDQVPFSNGRQSRAVWASKVSATLHRTEKGTKTLRIWTTTLYLQWRTEQFRLFAEKIKVKR